MPSFIYSPGVRVYIQTSNTTTGKEGPIYDVSDDLVSGTLTRRTNGVSTFSFVLMNQGRKYDYDPVAQKPHPLFSPNDKIIVDMKRVKWVRVFTGYLDSVPIFQAWPGNIQIEASCTLKRLQYFYWDPDSPSSQQLVTNALTAASPGGAADDGTTTSGDRGLKNLAITLLTQVANWDLRTIHISKIPDDWFTFAQSALKKLLEDLGPADAYAKEIMDTLGDAATLAGGSTTSNTSNGTAAGNATGALKAGNFGGRDFDSESVGFAETIYNVGVQKGASQQDIMRAIACAIGESGMKNIGFGDAAGPDSCGLFQQRPSQGWGTREQILTPSYAAGKFYDGLLAIGNREQLSDTQAIHQVQRNADPNYYTKFIASAQALVSAIVKGAASGVKKGDNQTVANATGIPTQDALLSKVTGLFSSGGVSYKELTGSASNVVSDSTPSGLNEAGLISWAFVQASGDMTRIPPVSSASALAVFCRQNSALKINVSDGLKTAGAVLFSGKDENSASGVGISLGNGHQVYSMTTGGIKLREVTTANFAFTYLLPRVSYTKVSANDGGTVSSTASGGTSTATNNDWQVKIIPNPYQVNTDVSANSTDPLDKELLSYQWVPQLNGPEVANAATLTGRRALLNDVPLMPYFNNVMTSAQRSFCSAPNGDLMAWFPDYFGWYGTAAKMHIKDIELKNFSMVWSDENLITHYFTAASETSTFDVASANLSMLTGHPIVKTVGIASVEDRSIMSMMFAVEPDDEEVKKFGEAFLKKFGARPQFDQLVGISGPKGEFFSALYRFFQAWTYQFNADVPITFMPEVWPGMLLVLDDFGFQAYVTTVTHTFAFGPGGGFNTTVNIAAPSRIGEHGPLDFLAGLPVSGTRLAKPSDFIPPAEEKAADKGTKAALDRLAKGK